jgi:hypothetical protein
MTDPLAPAPAPVANPNLLEFELPGITGKRSFDLSTIPADNRLDFLRSAVRTYIANRVNAVTQRHAKDPTVVSWYAYDEASKADPLQSAVAKPDAPRPASPDLEDALNRALADLVKGEIKRKAGEPKERARKDPLVATVTKAVITDVYNARKATDPKYSYLTAQKDVGVDGIAYLKAMIDAKVAAGQDRGPLEKMLDEKYINPAKIMLGLTVNKKIEGLPSIL